MVSKNSSSADNQQERLKTIGWIVGFVDGEGCFSVSIIRNQTTKSGFQVFPEFVVTQGEKSLKSLKILADFFGCGKIFINRRNDNHRENLYRFCVRSICDLNKKIIPFFKTNNLRTSKSSDFIIFCRVIDIMIEKKHLSKRGLNNIRRIAEKMNRKTNRF